MKALIYHGPGSMSWSEAPRPEVLNPGDAIVQVDTTTICGTDLHILKGDVPAVQPGRILGHEGVGTVVETGPGVHDFVVDDRVLISCIKSCGHCPNCRSGLYSHCLGDEGQAGIGWVFGHLIDGTQAEYVRVPYADNSLYKVPEGVSNVEAVMLSDILPTGFEIGVLAGKVSPGDVVAVIGSGPVGLAAITTAGLCGAGTIVAIDRDANRLRQAMEFGATDAVDSGSTGWQEKVTAMTDGAGVDVAIEAVGLPETFSMALALVRPGGHVANVGVHGTGVALPLQELWIRNINISMGLVNTNTTPMLLKLVARHKIPAAKFATHTFTFDQVLDAYDTFARAAETKALKVIIERVPVQS
ncbi:zinc-dependent alcohol dehydrogenase family protein [Arthrobacter sp. STN4]|uniref:zinc-dependent alcohol dehydrogenase family protein n=1 Tax=Arthrobacter sp. STN4 TaxID=2923276 RepID=UPI002119DCE2|nr:zinc-dependent alcohol dehydrogenase family protein [Arthrobacter sp. STN4]MCQ9165542.1 zinc-dependent alcohol dehydrogenase family protein [Arthrobacter sp. STN4]